MDTRPFHLLKRRSSASKLHWTLLLSPFSRNRDSTLFCNTFLSGKQSKKRKENITFLLKRRSTSPSLNVSGLSSYFSSTRVRLHIRIFFSNAWLSQHILHVAELLNKTESSSALRIRLCFSCRMRLKDGKNKNHLSFLKKE